MGLLDGLLGSAGSIDLDSLAKQVGLSPEDLKSGGEAMLGKLAGGGATAGEAAASAAAQTGLPLDKLEALLPALASQFGEGGVEGLLGKLGGAGGLLGGLDRDGDGNPINDIAGIAKGFLGR